MTAANQPSSKSPPALLYPVTTAMPVADRPVTKVREFNDIADLEQIQAEWNSLLVATKNATFFQTIDWLRVYWRHFGEGQKLRVMLVEDEHQTPIGVVPMVVRKDQRKLGSIRTLTYPMDDWGSFYGPISPDPQTTLHAALDHIVATPRDWEVLSFRWLDSTAPESQFTETALSDHQLKFLPSQRAEIGVINIDGSWDEYLQSRGSKFRNNRKRWLRRLQEQGEMRVEHFRPQGGHHNDSDPRWDLYDTCVDLAQRSWQGSSTSGTTISHECIREFLRDVHSAAAYVGAACIDLIYLNDRPVAFNYGYTWSGYTLSLRVGYDADVNDKGVGNVMWLESIQHSFDCGDWLYDMGVGSLDYKKFYFNQQRPIMQLDHYPLLSPRAQLMRLKTLFSPTSVTSVSPS